jgi:hypothetical protein
MRLPFTWPRLAAIAGAALLACGGAAGASPVLFKAELSAASEVPPNDSKGTGSVEATYDPDTRALTWKGSISGLTGPATAAHFHGPAPAGKNAGVVIPISGAEKGSFQGSATLTNEQSADLLAGQWYVNIHTAAHTAGEIRGQLLRQ